jgi:zinc/manganese transport system substrate-binding protein
VPSILRLALPAVVGVLALFAAACGGARESGAAEGGPRVLASTALIAEFAERVAGEDASVSGIIPPGVDLHSYEPPPEVARRLAGADLVLVNGYRLEEGLLDVIVENRPAGIPVVAVSRGLEPLAGGHEDEAHEEDPQEDDGEHGEAEGVDPLAFAEGDPHFWLDVAGAIRYVENIRDALVGADQPNADGYRSRAEALIEELRTLDGEVRAQLDAIPAGRRKIVVFHDGYSYFARAYGFELAAVLVPSGANQQTSAREVARVIEVVRREQIPAVYREPEFDARAIESVAAETGARVLTLVSTYTDDVTSYGELMRANAGALAEGLGE